MALQQVATITISSKQQAAKHVVCDAPRKDYQLLLHVVVTRLVRGLDRAFYVDGLAATTQN